MGLRNDFGQNTSACVQDHREFSLELLLLQVFCLLGCSIKNAPVCHETGFNLRIRLSNADAESIVEALRLIDEDT